MSHSSMRQRGATLIEVLITILILSLGMLSLSGMLAFAVQMPKFSAYRSTAVMVGASYVERMRANVEGFGGGAYRVTNTFNTAPTFVATCTYPNCTSSDIATKDIYDVSVDLSHELPGGGMRMQCNGACTNREGDLWIMWQEPPTFAAINAASNDECPAGVTFAVQPRCIHIRFHL